MPERPAGHRSPHTSHVPFPAVQPTVAIDLRTVETSSGDAGSSVAVDPSDDAGFPASDAAWPSPAPGSAPPPVAETATFPARSPERRVAAVPSELEPSTSVLASMTQPLALAALAPLFGAVVAVSVLLADRLHAVGVVAALVGVSLGALGVALVARRIHHQVDRPLLDLHSTLARLGAGDSDARVAVVDETPMRPVLDSFDELAEATAARLDLLRRKAEWGDQSRMIFEALELAEDEDDAYAVVQDALALMDPGRRIELLMTSRGQTRLRAAAHNPTVTAPGCPVDTTAACVAIRRGQAVTADSSESINSCPRLRDRPEGPCSATCVPVTVSGQPVGVLHAVGPDRHPPGPMVVDRLVTVAAQVGNRVAALRALETSREEAATDGLTGLSNRRVLEVQLGQLLDGEVTFVMVLADLDRFKVLNDTFGHEAGDRALQLFARVLQDNIRDHDLVARVGGEEFVVVYPEMSVLRSIEAIERIRQALEGAIARSSVQPFTCSFGVTHSSVGATVNEVLRVADAGLLRAKALGGDQVVYADEAIAAEVFGTGAQPGRMVSR